MSDADHDLGCKFYETCKECGKTKEKIGVENINAHHIKDFMKYPELRYEIANGKTLCNSCHKKEHDKRNKNAKN